MLMMHDMNNLTICVVTENKKDFLALLLLGDELENDIDKYLERGDLIALYDGDLKSVCVVTDEGGGVLEIQNIATDTRYQRQGYAARLVGHVADHYAGRYDKIILGTGDVPGVLSFYEKCGFIKTHIIADYFTTHFDYPIIEHDTHDDLLNMGGLNLSGLSLSGLNLSSLSASSVNS